MYVRDIHVPANGGIVDGTVVQSCRLALSPDIVEITRGRQVPIMESMLESYAYLPARNDRERRVKE